MKKRPLTQLKRIKLIALTVLLVSGVNLVFAADVPDDISNLAAESTDSSVVLTWSEPNNNGSAITSYTVEYKPLISETWIECLEASCTDTTAGAAVTGLTNWTTYNFRVQATNLIGDSGWSNEATTTPTSCGTLLDNDDSGGTTTVSDTCLGLNIEAGSLFIENIPDSFTFPLKFSSPTSDQASFSNDNPLTSELDVSTNPDDILTVRDLRNDAAGFYITITSTPLTNGLESILLENLYIATSCPDGDDLAADLYGSPTNCTNSNGAEFGDGASNTGDMDMTETVHSDNATGTNLSTLIDAFTDDGQPLDGNDPDTEADTIVIMDSTGARIARMSQALGFYLNIPADTDSGTYSVLFTLDLISAQP